MGNTQCSSPVPNPDRALVSKAPDGGFDAWMVVFGAWCSAFCSFGWINSVGVFQDYYESAFKQYSAGTISWILSLEIFFIHVMGPVVGKIFDSCGPRYLIIFGTIAHVFGLMMVSISTQFYQLLLSQGICSAIGASAVFFPSINCVGGWFHENRGFALGVTLTGSSIGGVLFPIMVNHLIREIGFEWAVRVVAFIILFLLGIANLTVKSRLPPTPRTLAFKEFVQPLREIPLDFTVFGCLLFTLGFFIPMNYLEVEATAEGMRNDLAQYLIPLLNAASVFGRVSAGLISDKVGRYNVFIIVTYLTGILILALWIPAASNAGLITFAITFGCTSGAYISLCPALVAQISATEEIGIRTGLLFAVISIGGLTASPIAGAILSQSNGSFLGVKAFAGVSCLAGATSVTLARISKTGPQVAKKF